MTYLIIIGSIIFWGAVGLLFHYAGVKYKSDHNPNNPNDIFFNPVAQELQKKNEYDRRNW